MLQRHIVAALIISADQQVLFGKKAPPRGGVYLDKWHIPGGGVEANETEQQALQREIREETGLDLQTWPSVRITLVDNIGSAVALKRLRTGENVPCAMQFSVYQVELDQNAGAIPIQPGDDFAELKWIPISQLSAYRHTSPSVSLFLRLGWLTAAQALAQRDFVSADLEPIPHDNQDITWRVSAYALVVTNGQVLLAKNRQEKYYDVIGGGVEFGETVADTLYREAKEEGGVVIKIGALLFAATDWFYHKKGHYHQSLQLYHEAEVVQKLDGPTDPDIEWSGYVPISELEHKYKLAASPEAVGKILAYLASSQT